MGRRTSLASLAGDQVEEVPGSSDLTLLHMPLTKLVPTRFNPRRNFGNKEQLCEFGEVLKKRQLQPAVVVSRTAYLKLWPDEAELVGDASYVIANGERRYRASKEVGLEKLWVVHREEVASSRADFLDAVLSENNDRDDLDPIERALGIDTMVQELDGVGAVAAHYGKSAGWVSQQRKMLKLVPDLQMLVSSGEMPQREGYRIAGLPAGEQVAEWRVELVRREQLEKARQEAKKSKGNPGGAAPKSPVAGKGEGPSAESAASDGSSFSALKSGGSDDNGGEASPVDVPAQLSRRDHPGAQPSSDAGQGSGEPNPSADEETGGQELGEEAGEAATPTPGKGSQPRQLPYDEPFYVVQHLRLKMSSDAFAQGGRVWMAAMREHQPEAYHALLRELTKEGAESS
ncbi:ParB/RepB/Spo0J family partition protein [Streptomyces sp. NPDC048516]|uniref:ParB/RepB/Spo0J family partition protein n=1 Tax=Streptomyces sp. NPDC048516 TaxID=3365565 RepID=UPI0037109282